MTFLERILVWFEAKPSHSRVEPVSLAPEAPELVPEAPALSVQRYSDANYAVSRATEARKMHVMGRVCEINNAAAEDVIDRKGTIVRPPAKPWAVIPMTEQELDDAIHLAEVTYVMENAHDPRQ